MKKTVLLLVGILIGLGSYAQGGEGSEGSTDLMPKDGKNAFSLEVLLGQNFGGGNSLVTAPGVKLRYFLRDHMALRFGLTYTSYLSQDVATENPDGTGEQGTQDYISATFRTKIGFEYHFGKTKRMSPYVGIDGLIGTGLDKTEATNYNSGFYQAGYNSSTTYKTLNYGTVIFAGLDFYVAKNLYLGIEFGYGFEWMVNQEGEMIINDNGNETKMTTPRSVSRQFGFGALGGLRLGWRF